MMKSLQITTTLMVLFTVGCTQPGETTGIGAAAGGALGAGLGAIIGSQTGAAGSGLALGAVAGSAGGALIGNAFQAQQEAIRSQDEAIERQERMVRAQRSEIDELRKMNQDPPQRRASSNSSSQHRPKIAVPSQQTARRTPQFENSHSQKETPPRFDDKKIDTNDLRRPASTTESEVLDRATEEAPRAKLKDSAVAEEAQILERDLTDPTSRDVPIVKGVETLGEYEENRNLSGKDTEERTARNSAREKSNLGSSSCQQAQEELSQSGASTESSEKLYHLRRALRLCPENPSFHHELGKVYLTLKRPADAEYEFKQALSVDPSFKPAQRSLNQLNTSTTPKF
jgi:hypothetical protein